jgi:hypothetical protein
MYDLTRVGLDTLTAELNYRHTVDTPDLAGANAAPALGHRAMGRRVLRRRTVRHGHIRHGEIR